jgi:uncharacterized protein (DUF433 family)
MTIHDRIEANPKIMLGKAVIKGTRITVVTSSDRGVEEGR